MKKYILIILIACNNYASFGQVSNDSICFEVEMLVDTMFQYQKLNNLDSSAKIFMVILRDYDNKMELSAIIINKTQLYRLIHLFSEYPEKRQIKYGEDFQGLLIYESKFNGLTCGNELNDDWNELIRVSELKEAETEEISSSFSPLIYIYVPSEKKFYWSRY